mmetsp:Transcript_6635/g.11153  ORF Transcript_6635/g.11153 Transcript_6635/m.11153 type:complete len:165 (-) Transcript_6635:194-688(-)
MVLFAILLLLLWHFWLLLNGLVSLAGLFSSIDAPQMRTSHPLEWHRHFKLSFLLTMVIPARSSSNAYLRGSDKSFSTQTLIATFFGSSLLALSFLAGVFYNESSHYDVPLKSNLRGAATLKIPVPVVSDTLIDPNQDSTQEFFPDSTKHNQKKWGKKRHVLMIG